MEYGIMPTIAATCFLISLIIIYFSKGKPSSITNKIFRLLVIATLLYCLTEIFYVASIKTFNIFILNHLCWRSHWSICCLCWLFVYLYLMTIIYNIKVSSLKELFNYNFQIKIMSIFFVLGAIVALAVPYTKIFDAYDPSYILYNSDKLFVPQFLVTATYILIMTINLIKNRKNLQKGCVFISVSIIICDTTAMILQVMYPQIAVVSLSTVVVVYLCYFAFSDPDIEILKEINIAQSDIEKSSKTKTDFLSNMTFEIKTPIDLINNICENLVSLEEIDQEEVKKLVAQITVSGNNLLEIVNNVLDISKIETGKSVIMEKEYKIKDILDDAVDSANAKIGSKPIQLIANIDENISSVLYGDSSKLYQAVLNIITNAAKYTDVGKITFNVSSTKNGNKETLLFKVVDTGTGIKPEDQDKLFSKGTRLDNSKSNEIEGSGYGLSISKKYVEELGGKIWFTSEYRVGSTFYIEVTQKIIDSTPLSITSKVANVYEKDDKIDCSKYTVLIVDDNKPNVKVMKRILERYKFKVETVSNGKDCIFKVKKDEHFDLIFMDHVMPDMDGLQTLHILKCLDGYTLPPIIALTANAISGMKEIYLNEGYDEYLSKPINLGELDRIIKKYFN